MNNNEWIFYLFLVSTNCIIAYYWAMYGFLELGINRPVKIFPILAVIVGMATVFVGGYLQRAEILKLEFITQKNINMASIYLFGPPLALMALVRLFFSKSGIPEYNRARAATMHWMSTGNIKFGEILETEGDLLKNFPRAINALENFDKAIAAQKRGSLVRSLDVVVPIADKELDYYGLYHLGCPACGFEVGVPNSNVGVDGQCNHCGAFIAAKVIDENLYISVSGGCLNKRRKIPVQGKRNIALALSEKALLLRMMNNLDEAEKSINEALEFIERALSIEPKSEELLTLKSLILFRAGEIAHVKKQKEKAERFFWQCLAVDESIGNMSERDLVLDLINSLQ